MTYEKELWKSPPEHPVLDSTTVHVWLVDLENAAFDVDVLKQILSTDEKQRAERLIDINRRNTFISARAQLRLILADYLQCPPLELRFNYNEQGKPFLADTKQDLFFNLSHSQASMVVLVSSHQYCGIDLEWINPKFTYPAVARQFFTSDENQQLNSYPQHKQRRCFFRLWTRKEAKLKALGCGFSVVSDQIVTDIHQWSICALPLKKNYLCSLAVNAKIDRIERYNGVELK